MKKIIAIMLAALVPQATVYANIASYRTDCAADGNITITGSFDTEEAPSSLGLRVLKDGHELSELTGDAEADLDLTEYIKQTELSPDQKSFTISLVLPEGSSGLRKARLLGTGFSEPADIELHYVTSSDYSAAVSAVKSAAAAGLDAFKTVCGNNLFCLGFDESVTDSVTTDEVLNVVYNTVSDGGLDEENRLESVNLWRAASAAAALGKGAEFDLARYSYCFDSLNANIKKWIENITQRNGNDAQERLKSLISGQSCNSVGEFEKRLKEALVLTITEYHGGIGNIGAVISDFSDITGITAKNEVSVYQNIGGKRYQDIASLLSAYSAAKKSSPTTGGGGGGGGGGGSGSSGGSGGRTRTVAVGVDTPGGQSAGTENETIDLPFTDLDMAAWAYEAVSTLYDRGIINGKTETEYAPLDRVTREEFVKILVCASGYENADYAAGRFADVEPGAWYEKYVCIAAEQGIVNGVENDRFGIGDTISRQDMAVMIYRLLGAKGAAPAAAEPTFEDKDQIGDYAKEAVGALAAGGMINGMDGNIFSPMGYATRAEAAQIVFNVLDYIS